MKRIIFLALSAMLLCLTASAQENHYFIDGKRIPLHGDTGLAKAPRMASRFRDNPATFFFSLNPELDRGFNNKSDFLIDEFKIWSAPKPPFRPM